MSARGTREPPAEAAKTIATLSDRILGLWQRRNPLMAGPFGFPDADAMLPDLSPEGIAGLAAEYQALAAEATAVDPTALRPTEATTRRVLIELGEANAESLACGYDAASVDNVRSFSSAALLANLGKAHLDGADRVERHLERLGSLARFIDAEIASLEVAATRGDAPVARSVQVSIDELDVMLAVAASADPLVTTIPKSLPRQRERALRLVADEVRPAVARHRGGLAALLPAARGDDRAGLCHTTSGPAQYLALLREETTLHLDPDRVHADALARHSQLLETAGPGGLDGMRDPGPLVPGDGLLRGATALMADALAGLPRLFGLPFTDCPVRAMPAATAARYGFGQYLPGAVDGSRPGVLYVNTLDPRAASEVPALVAGAAVPGSHVYWGYAFAADVPLFRRVAFLPAFVKGWADHSLVVGQTMGLFEGEDGRRGLLDKQLVNLARVIVDTGIHAKGWGYHQAVEFCRTGTLMSERDARTTVTSALSVPGQAGVWHIGGDRIRSALSKVAGHPEPVVHDALLRQGAVPLEMLDELLRPLQASGPRPGAEPGMTS